MHGALADLDGHLSGPRPWHISGEASLSLLFFDITVHFDKKGFFAGGVLLEDYTADFKSQPFSAKLVSSQFYQDPRDPNLKKLVAGLSFSHPVDTDQFTAVNAAAFAVGA